VNGILMVEPSLEFIAERLERLQTEFRAFRHLSSDVAQLRADLLRVQENFSDLRESHDKLRESHDALFESHDALRDYVLELRTSMDGGFATTDDHFRAIQVQFDQMARQMATNLESFWPKSAARNRDPAEVTRPAQSASSWRCLQVVQDAAERLLVGIMFFPSAEVADVPLVAELRRPRLVGLHHLLIDADGKQHGLATAPLLGERFADLVLDSVAGDRVLREDQQQLIADANGGVDRVPRLRADRQVVRREPTAYAAVLQVGVQPLYERVVLGRVTDEAGIILDRLFEQRGQVVDQPIRQAAAAQEDQGQAARPLPGAVVEDARAPVNAGLQTLRRAQVDIREHGFVEVRPPEIHPPEVRPA
jgi:hypothetical protein